MDLHTLMFTRLIYYRLGRTSQPKKFTLHSTGANNPWLKRYVGPDDGLLGRNPYGNHWNNYAQGKCPHGFTGKLADGSVASYQVLPWDIVTSHSYNGLDYGNIGWEICEDDLKDPAYFWLVYRESAEVAAKACRECGFPVSECQSHAERNRRTGLSDHKDPEHWFKLYGVSMDDWRAVVASLLGERLAKPETPATEIIVGSRVVIRPEAQTYNPTSSAIKDSVRAYTHIVTQTTYAGREVIRGGEACVLLGKRLLEDGREAAGISTWVSVKNLDLYGAEPAEPETPEPAEPVTPGIGVGAKVRFVDANKTYWPGGPTIPLWVLASTHVVTQTVTGTGRAVTKGGEACVLLGKRIALGREVAGINTWCAVSGLEAVE